MEDPIENDIETGYGEIYGHKCFRVEKEGPTQNKLRTVYLAYAYNILFWKVMVTKVRGLFQALSFKP